MAIGSDCIFATQHDSFDRSVSFTLQESNDDKSPSVPLSTASEIQHLRDQLEQQAMQTREALFQLMQVREQLISETNARIEAQVRIQYQRLIHLNVVLHLMKMMLTVDVIWVFFFSLSLFPIFLCFYVHIGHIVRGSGKNATVAATESRIARAFGFAGWLHVHRKRTSWPNIGKHQSRTTGSITAIVPSSLYPFCFFFSFRFPNTTRNFFFYFHMIWPWMTRMTCVCSTVLDTLPNARITNLFFSH